MAQSSIFLQDQNRHVRFYLSLYIKRRREELGWTREEAATHLQLPLHTYKKIETGRMRLDATLFENLKVILNLNSDELFEISRIANIAYANAIAKVLSPNYPE